jgi:UDP:flavonoid glycosyltransferase YjiC (YdhE family)
MMRVLFTTLPSSGHWHPLIPFADSLRAAGHEVAFATTPVTCSSIAAHGFPCFPVGTDETAEEARERGVKMVALGTEGPAWIFPTIFAGVWAAERLPDLLAVCQEWQPAVLVREETEFAGCIAAEKCGLPHASVQITAWRPWLQTLIIEPLNRLRESVELPPDPDLAILFRYLLIVPGPPSYFDPMFPLPATAHAVRHVAFDRSGDEQLPAWVHDLPDRPVVYATMGTVFNQVPGILDSMLTGLRDEPITLIMTTGRNQDPVTFGSQPPHVHIERYVPQSLLFPYCDLVVTHGGSGTVLTALGHGLPMAIVPVSADQPDNAHRCEQLGVATVVSPDDRTPEAFRNATREVLQNPAFRQNAARLREEMERLPGPRHVVGWLERLAGERRPLVASP